MRFVANYTDDSMSFDADDWRDAIDQALDHEAQEYGLLVDLKLDDTPDNETYIAEGLAWMEPVDG